MGRNGHHLWTECDGMSDPVSSLSLSLSVSVSLSLYRHAQNASGLGASSRITLFPHLVPFITICQYVYDKN